MLYSQNEKLKQERTDALKEQMRSTGYRRVLMSQLLNDQRIKDYVAEIMAEDKHLPGLDTRRPALPQAEQARRVMHRIFPARPFRGGLKDPISVFRHCLA